MESLAFARALHVVAVVAWIGGVAMVTTVLLPAFRSLPEHEDPYALFERVERRFAWQARVLTLVTAATGFYMLHRMGAWSRYLMLPEAWWLHAMTFVWAVFTLVLFVLEPLVLHAKLRQWAEADPVGTLVWLQRAHVVLLTVSLLTAAGAVAGSHGWTFRGGG